MELIKTTNALYRDNGPLRERDMKGEAINSQPEGKKQTER